MSLIKSGPITLNAYLTSISQQVYQSTQYALTGEKVFIQYENDNKTSLQLISSYITDFGDNIATSIVTTDPITPAVYSYSKAGTYFITYSTIYVDNSYKVYALQYPFIINDYWEQFNQQNVRFDNEITLSLPYTLEQVNIQPNEWGVSDIFNTAINRLQENLNYLISNTQTLNTQSPLPNTFKWLGNNAGTRASGIKWFTSSFNSEYVNSPEIATSSGSSYFTNVIDSFDTDDFIYVLDNNTIRVFTNEAVPVEINFLNKNEIAELLVNPVSMDYYIDQAGNVYVFVADSGANKIYRFQIDTSSNPTIYLQLSIGGFGGINDHIKFNTPIQVVYDNGYVYVLDYKNFCIKQYNNALNWVYTYTNDILTNEQPLSIGVHPINNLLYVLTENYNVYIFDNQTNILFETLDISDSKDNSNLIKITFDSDGSFFYILTQQNIIKYSASGIFITILQIPKSSTVLYTSIKNSKDKSLIISSPLCLLKCQDVLEIFRLGEGLPYEYWDLSQLQVSDKEFNTDLIYNRALIRITQNIKSFRNTLNAKFIIVTEHTNLGVVKYLSWTPISTSELPVFSDDIENEKLGIGVNELHVPQVINKELKKIYDALNILVEFLNIKAVTLNSDCKNGFCWSWNAMSCYNLSFPVIKNCSVNPITYAELSSSFNLNSYAPSKTWGEATSICCQNNNT